jgi:hypothetical protein
LKVEDNHTTSDEILKDTTTDHSRCDILIRHLEQTVEGLKDDKLHFQKKLE